MNEKGSTVASIAALVGSQGKPWNWHAWWATRLGERSFLDNVMQRREHAPMAWHLWGGGWCARCIAGPIRLIEAHFVPHICPHRCHFPQRLPLTRCRLSFRMLFHLKLLNVLFPHRPLLLFCFHTYGLNCNSFLHSSTPFQMQFSLCLASPPIPRLDSTGAHSTFCQFPPLFHTVEQFPCPPNFLT